MSASVTHVAPPHKLGQDRGAAATSARPLLWTIRNKRYAIPASFVERHPGGVDAITLGKGRNCTELFESYHSLTDRPDAMLGQWFVEDAKQGDADYDTTFDWAGDKALFYTDLKREARAFFAGRSHKASPQKWAVVLGFAALACLTYVFGFLRGRWWAPMLMPCLYWLGPACMLHDGAHFALSSNPMVNRVCAAVGSLHMGVWAWYHQHVVGHHAYTNMLDKDPDLRSFEGEPPEHWYGHRVTPWAPYFPMYGRWFKSLLITMPFSCLQPSVRQDTAVWLYGHYDNTVAVTAPPPAWRVALHLAIRVLLWSMLFVVPWFLFSPLKAAFFMAWPALSYGVIYYVFSQISHINEDCFQTLVPQRDWAAHQVASSLDWGVYHFFWKYLSVALNLQTVHHLFPQVDSCHYMELRRRVVVPVCKRHNVKINEAATLWEALVVHFKHVHAINRAGINEAHPATRPKTL